MNNTLIYNKMVLNKHSLNNSKDEKNKIIFFFVNYSSHLSVLLTYLEIMHINKISDIQTNVQQGKTMKKCGKKNR